MFRAIQEASVDRVRKRERDRTCRVLQAILRTWDFFHNDMRAIKGLGQGGT